MTRRRLQRLNTLGNFVVEALLVDLAKLISEARDVPWSKVTESYKRRVRRGNPGLTLEYVMEEMIRRMAKEAACYSIFHRPGELIEELEHDYRRVLRDCGNADFLTIWEYHFPINEDSVFASEKYAKCERS